VLKHTKCLFAQRNVDYLGHMITVTGIAMDESKIEVVKAWPLPKTIKALCGFVGLTGY